jgi:hypothetical protein
MLESAHPVRCQSHAVHRWRRDFSRSHGAQRECPGMRPRTAAHLVWLLTPTHRPGKLAPYESARADTHIALGVEPHVAMQPH